MIFVVQNTLYRLHKQPQKTYNFDFYIDQGKEMGEYFQARLKRLEREARKSIRKFLFAFVLFIVMVICFDSKYIEYLAYLVIGIAFIYMDFKVCYFLREEKEAKQEMSDDERMRLHLIRDSKESKHKKIASLGLIFLGGLILGILTYMLLTQLSLTEKQDYTDHIYVGCIVSAIVCTYFSILLKRMRKLYDEIQYCEKYTEYLKTSKVKY